MYSKLKWHHQNGTSTSAEHSNIITHYVIDFEIIINEHALVSTRNCSSTWEHWIEDNRLKLFSFFGEIFFSYLQHLSAMATVVSQGSQVGTTPTPSNYSNPYRMLLAPGGSSRRRLNALPFEKSPVQTPGSSHRRLKKIYQYVCQRGKRKRLEQFGLITGIEPIQTEWNIGVGTMKGKLWPI